MQHMGEDTLLLLITGNSYFFSIKSPLCCQSGEEIKTCCFTCTPFGRGRKSRGFSQQLHSDLWCPMTTLSLSLRPLVRLEPLLTPLHVHMFLTSLHAWTRMHVLLDQASFEFSLLHRVKSMEGDHSYRHTVVVRLNLTGDRIMVVKLRLFLSSITLEFLSPEHCRYCKVWDNRPSRLRPTMPYCDTRRRTSEIGW